jgi:ABC-type siderophore export system fused ATPase/permease subunit
MPTLDIELQQIDLMDLDIDINAQNFIYKLSSPIIERIIRSKIQSVLPIKPAETLSKFISKIPTVHIHQNLITLYPHVSKATIETLHFSQQSINCTLLLGDAEVDIVV